MSEDAAETFLKNQAESMVIVDSLAEQGVSPDDLSLDRSTGHLILSSSNPVSLPKSLASKVEIHRVAVSPSGLQTLLDKTIPPMEANALGVMDSNVQPASGEIEVVMAPSASDAAMKEISSRLPSAKVRRADQRDTGVPLYTTNSGQKSTTYGGSTGRASICSLGVVTVQGNMLTAGHCARDYSNLPSLGWTVYDGGSNAVGVTSASDFKNGGIDRGTIKLYSNRVRPGYYYNYYGGINRFTAVWAAVVNQYVCKYGTSSGVTCGYVVQKNTFYISGNGWVINAVFRTSVCGMKGDSGGPVVAPLQAGTGAIVGIVSGGPGDSQCAYNQGNPGGGTLWYTPINTTAAAYKQTVALG